MTLQAGDKLMSLTDVSEMLGIPVHTAAAYRLSICPTWLASAGRGRQVGTAP